MMRRISSGLLFFAAALGIGRAAATFDHRTPLLCYTTDGADVLTVQADVGPEFAPYPFPIESSVEDTGDVVVVRHQVTLRRLGQHTFLPVVVR